MVLLLTFFMAQCGLSERSMIEHKNEAQEEDPPSLSKSKTTKHIIFDLGGVMIHFPKIRPLFYIGIGNILWYTLIKRKNPTKILYHLLDIAYKMVDEKEKTDIVFKDHVMFRNHPLTALTKEALLGHVTCNQLLKATKEALVKAQAKKLIEPRERMILEKFADLIIDPKTGTQYLEISSSCVSLIRKLKEDKNNKLYILSNWPADSFELLSHLHNDVFNLFYGMVISSHVHLIKPDKKIYEKLLVKYNLDPRCCYFVDDQQENLDAAKDVGIHGVLWKNASDAEIKLKKLHVIEDV